MMQFYNTLINILQAIAEPRDIQSLVKALSLHLHSIVEFNHFDLLLYDPETRSMSLFFPDVSPDIHHTIEFEEGPGYTVWNTQKPFICDGEELAQQYPQYAATRADEHLCMYCVLPLTASRQRLGVLNFASSSAKAYGADQMDFLQRVAALVAIAVDNVCAYQKVSELSERLANEKLYLEEEFQTQRSFDEIVGKSSALKHVLAQAEQVASSDCTVLIMGETGTGKELLARAIHNLSARSSRTLVKVNCAAIPTGLLESEMFGHEKGAFTGAISQRIGRLELANLGTLFLDEVGDIPFELQPKLLRAIQEQEFERLGSTRPIHVDVRLVSATNRNLEEMVTKREFRSDLYYRLNVFPLYIPPLRERKGDIPLLVHHFAQKYTARMKKEITSIPSQTMRVLESMPWLGNVRELANVIERAVILSRGSVLEIPLAELRRDPLPEVPIASPMLPPSAPTNSVDHEREQILHALREANGIVAGPNGAATRLGWKRGTLLSRMQQLGISLYSANAKKTERELILNVLSETNGIVAGQKGAAAKLGIQRSTLLSRMQRLGISPKEVKVSKRLNSFAECISGDPGDGSYGPR
jgi:formate hydrogenlyase transcriptional activator